jgi:outer membrane protein OmpA-like peptidoglycan-associated protein
MEFSVRQMQKEVMLRLLFTLCVLAQKKYVTQQTASEKAVRAYLDGKMEASNGNFAVAIGYFERAIKHSPDFIDAHLMIAGLQYESEDWARAKTGFEKVLFYDPDYEPRVRFSLARCAWQLDSFETAARQAELFLTVKNQNKNLRYEAQRILENARFAAEAIKKPVPFEPKSVGNGINSPEEEYLPTLTADGKTMIFTRNEQRDENFYQSEKNGDTWLPAKAMTEVNTPMNEGAQHISPDGTWLVFTACNRRDDGSQGSCDLYWSQLKNGNWTKPVPFSNALNSKDWDAQPCISADGKTLFFSSTRTGSQGGKDLWYSTRLSNGKWAIPQPLPAGINTLGDEQTPFLHPDGRTLYFTSNGLPGMGYNDLYVTRRLSDTTWTKPQNLGYPINTKANEGTLTVAMDGRTAYFAATYPGGAGQNDIYYFDLPEAARAQPVSYVLATVKDAVNNKPLIAKIDIYDVKSNKLITTLQTKSNGSFLACLPPGVDYALNVNRPKYLFYSDHFNLSDSSSFSKPYELSIALQPIGKDSSGMNGQPLVGIGQPVVLKNVFFETGSAALLPESTVELERLTELLQNNPGLNIQINGHTDDVGDDRANMTLSDARANAVLQYLIGKSISPARLRAKGFGESKPIVPNTTAEGRAKNRRTEFEVWK